MASQSASTANVDLTKRLERIAEVEKQIGDLLRFSQSCISELAKDKQISKVKMEESSALFKNALTNVNNTLSGEMAYLQNVCVGSAHQGSTFASQKNIEMAEDAEFALHTELTNLTEAHFPPPVKTEETPMDQSTSASTGFPAYQ